MLIPEKNNLVGIELLRFIAAFSVLIWHYQHFFFEGTQLPVDFEISDQPFFPFLKLFYSQGYNGVQMFWAISGYIFFYVYFKKIKNLEINAKEFSLRRFSRLYPLHFFTLIIVLTLQIIILKKSGEFSIYSNNDLKYFFLNIFFVSHWFQDSLSYNGPIWSVSIEIAVLIFFFILCRYFNTYFVFLTALFLFILFFNYNFLISECILLFFCGGLLYLLKTNEIVSKYIKNFYIYFIFFLGTLVTIDITLIDTHTFIISKLSLYLKCLFILSLFTVIDKLITKFKIENLCKIFGSWTYACYLIHIPIQLTIISISNFYNLKIPNEENMFFLLYILFVFLLSHLVFNFFEKPAQSILRNKFL